MLKTAAGRALALSHRPWAVNKVMNRTHKFTRNKYYSNAPAKGHQWLKPYLNLHTLGSLIATYSCTSRFANAFVDWVTVRAEEETRQAAFHDTKQAFPLLDEKLISTLLQQDPHFSER